MRWRYTGGEEIAPITFAELTPRDRTRDKRRNKTNERTIVAIDGEGHNKGRDHLYDLLAASTRDAVASPDGLSTRQCFEFLLSLKQDMGSRYLFVGFSLNYDINMWLRDLSRKQLDALVHDGYVFWHEYRLRWRLGRTFSIYNRMTKHSILVYDVFGFFQTSFVRALRDWRVGDDAVVDEIAAMKERRGTFTVEDATAVREYCFRECELLVQLVRRLIGAVQHAEIPCSQWYGVGALASGLLKKNGLKAYMSVPVESMREPILCAYFGGRFEIAGSGHFGKVYGYDIKSAYPSVARSLPCLAHTEWNYVKWKPSRTLLGLALCHVEWNAPADTRFGPFPWRSEHRRILYPLNGRGWYWTVEVEAAMRLFPGCVKIIEAYTAIEKCSHEPFEFINDVYAVRQQFEKVGDYAHKALKLGLNALYGKTAQSLGDKKKVPPYQSYIWAGMITAGTRAVILDAIRESHNSVISIATDGLLSTKEIRTLHIGKALGNWERAEWESAFLIQPGIYRLSNPCHNDYSESGCIHRIEHTRGFGHTETDFDAIERDYDRDPLGKHHYKATRFIGAASAMAHKEYKWFWRKWIEAKRTISFAPSSRFPRTMRGDPLYHDACTLQGMPESYAYVPKQTWLESFLEDVDVVLDLDSL